jgi:hypothetical protein
MDVRESLTLDRPEEFRRFSPRHKGSVWSPANLKRVRKLIAERKMTEAGLAVLPPGFNTET